MYPRAGRHLFFFYRRGEFGRVRIYLQYYSAYRREAQARPPLLTLTEEGLLGLVGGWTGIGIGLGWG